MKTYTVRITETATYERTVEAANENEALSLALAEHLNDEDRDAKCTGVSDREVNLA